MIHRREFEDKLSKELLKLVHYNLQTFNSLKFFFKRHQGREVFQLLKKSVPPACSTEQYRFVRIKQKYNLIF